MVDIGAPVTGDHRPGLDVLHSLQVSCRVLLHDRAVFDDQYLVALGGLLPPRHPLLEAPALALDLLDVVLRAVLSGEGADGAEAESWACGARCAAFGLPDDAYPAVGRAVARAAREVAGDSWSSPMSSGWAAIHLWLVGHFVAGAAESRARGDVGSGGEGGHDPAAVEASADPAPAEGTRDRRALRGRKQKPAPDRTSDWSNVWGDTDAISNWAFDHAARPRRAGADD